MKLQLNNTKNMKSSLARVIRLTADDQIPLEKMRALTYGFSHLLAIQKHLDELRIEERLEAIEKQLEANNARR